MGEGGGGTTGQLGRVSVEEVVKEHTGRVDDEGRAVLRRVDLPGCPPLHLNSVFSVVSDLYGRRGGRYMY